MLNEKILECWGKATNKWFKVMTYIRTNYQKDGIELAIHAKSIDVYAIASIDISFFKPNSVNDLIDFFCSYCSKRFYYYNMPTMVVINLLVDLFLLNDKNTYT